VAGKRPHNEAIARRVREVAEDLATGLATVEIEANRAEVWNCSTRTIRRYLESARALLAELRERTDADWIGLHFSHRLRIMREAIDAGEFNASLAAAKDLAKLQQLYASDKAANAVAMAASAQLVQLLEGLHDAPPPGDPMVLDAEIIPDHG